MALSFEDSLKQSTKLKNMNYRVSALAIENEVNTSDQIVAYSGETLEESVWELDDQKYKYYEEYSDDNVSIIDRHKTVKVNQEQINLSQESNAQYIPFIMPRYYDGFDLSTTNIYIHFVNRNGQEDFAEPVNVYYSEDQIKFAWLVDKRATAVEGKLKFEIEAVGTTSRGDEYNWKTHPNEDIDIIKSLCGNGKIEVDDSWSGSLLTQVLDQVDIARSAANEARQISDSMQGYIEEAQDAVRDAEAAVVAAENATKNAAENIRGEVRTIVTEEVQNAMTSYYTKSEIDVILENIDISDQLEDIQNQIDNLDGLANFNVEYDGAVMTFYNGETIIKEIEINSDPTDEWTSEYTKIIEDKITEATNDIQDNLNEYKEKVDSDLESIHNDLDGLPQTLATDYYTKNDADDKFANKIDLNTINTNVTKIESSTTTNKENITTIGNKVAELETIVNGIDKSPRLTYEATYDTENIYTLWEVEGDGDDAIRTPKGQFKLQGGSGSSSSSVLKIEYVTKTPIIATINDKVKITYNFSGVDSSGDEVLEGVATWRVSNTIVATQQVVSGENTFDITPYIQTGSQKVMLSITDDAGSLVTKTWTVQKIDVHIESAFDDTLTYPLGTISFDYTPYGAVSKEIHFILDGEELDSVTTSASGIPMGYTLPSQSHGAHLLEVYMTSEINNNTIESNHIVKDILWYDASSTVPVIGCIYSNLDMKQYDTTNISYSVYDPKTESPEVVLSVNGDVVSTLKLDTNTQIWQFKPTEVGNHVLTIACGETIKTINVNVKKLDINIEPVTTGLVFDFNPVGKSNQDADRLWSNGDIEMTVSDNFDWVNGGYHIDNNGDQYFCVKAGTFAEINYHMFADDAKRNGKEMKLIFKTTNVQSANAKFLSCVDNTTGNDHIGIEMFAHEAYIYGSADKLNLKYSEDDIIEFEFNITKNTEKVTEICGYEDGVATRHLVYDDSFGFTQSTPKTIFLGSNKCDLHIYRLKIYNSSLTDRGILNNFIADARNAEEMIERYNRNQIYDENQNLTPDILAEKCPWLRVYVLSAPYFTNKKSDKVPYTTIRQIYKNGDPVLDNWTCYDCSHSGQGTSSDNYGASARNLDFIMNKSQRDGVEPYFILGDGKTRVTEISLTRTSIPNAYFNFKANVASSNHFTNAKLAKRYNEFNPYIVPYVREDESIIDHIKSTMEFYNAVVFIQETDTDLSTHREFADNLIHFYSIGNIGDSKKTDDTRLVDPNDRYECINEICDVELPLSDWPNTPEAFAALEAEQFDKSGTYEWRYIWEDGTDEENAEVREYCKQKWIEMYRFVVESSDEEFRANIGNYFVLDSVLYYYLFTTRYCMVDNRAKNSFWHYAKTGEVNADGTPVRKWDLTMMYDCDSSMSLNNYGNSVYRHGYEDTDTMDGTNEEVFRESDSTFFCRVRDLLEDKLKTMYNTLESKNAWHAESFLNEIHEWQKQFPEELWRLDCQRKYIRTVNESFVNGAGDPQYIKNMAQGRMIYPVKQWERSQEAYMASKYQSSVASSDNAVLRCTVPTGNLAVPVNYRLKLTPYDYMYLNVKYGTQEPIQVRAIPNVQYEIPFEGNSVDILDIYSASRIQDLGDLSSTYPATVDTAKAVRLKELHIGNSTEGYDNPYLTTITLGANYLLEVLNVENVSGLTQSLNLSALNNLKELYAHGTNTNGITFANGGAIQTAELPSITSMSAKNLIYLSDLDITSYDQLTTLTVENCSTIDVLNIVENAPNLNRVRITGINWNIQDEKILDKIYGMSGIDLNGYNTTQSVLSGKVHVTVIRQQKLYEYRKVWPDLEITFNTMIEQFPVTFMNEDGTILEIQYVDKGEDAVDPITRETDPMPIPTKESTISTDFTFEKWDSPLTDVFSERIVKAIYSESVRSYTIKYISEGVIMQESTGLYGSYVPYEGITPTYTLEENAYKYKLFNRWDKSGFIDGNKIVNAIFDEFEYTPTSFNNKQLNDLSPVELYAITKLGLDIANIDIDDGDQYSIELGCDINYDDIDSELIISEPQHFNGTNYLDTNIKLFDVDKDFILAIDYEFLSGNSVNSVLSQCFQSNGSNGFKLWYNNGAKITWGTSTSAATNINSREMIVIRHKKGDYNLTVYNSNMDTEIEKIELPKTRSSIANSTLVFGCMKADDGVYENFAIGNINWCKVWFDDLGEKACMELAGWIHEKVDFEVAGFKKYYLTENASKRCTMTLLASQLLEHKRMWNSNGTNAGGWAEATLNTLLNDRLYNAFPMQIKSLIKQVSVASSAGSQSHEITTSDCFVSIPAIIELCNESTVNIDPYIYEGSTISYMISNEVRKKAFADGTYASYWTRSPNVSYSNNYIHQIDANGGVYVFGTPKTLSGVLIEVSI